MKKLCSPYILSIILGFILFQWTGCNPLEEPPKTDIKYWTKLSQRMDYIREDGTPWINIDSLFDTSIQNEAILRLNYVPSVFDLAFDGHAVQVKSMTQNEMKLDTQLFHMTHFHFHSPGVHTIGEISFPLEIHILHESASGEKAILVLLVKIGKHNSMLEPILTHIPTEEGEHVLLPNPMNPMVLFPNPRDAYNFKRPLQTQAYHEVIHWIQWNHPIEMSKKQLALFKKR